MRYRSRIDSKVRLVARMSNRRRDVQQRHERFHVNLLINALNRRHRASFRVTDEPNPPEAIIQSGRTTRWVEVVSAFWNGDYARDVYSHATEGEIPKPIGDGLFMNMTPEFAKNFARSVGQKLEKPNYEPLRNIYGPGYLVVPILFPFFGRSSFPFIEREWLAQLPKDRGCFRSIYLTYPVVNTYAVSLWRPPSGAYA